jgi:restriction endonuclease S subunit
MKKSKICLAIALMVGITVCTTGCFASCQNNKVLKGGYFTTNKSDYIVFNESGGQIMDVYKLRNVYVESESSSDGVRFADSNGNGIVIQGDVKIIRVNNSVDWDNYVEYHIETDIVPYTEFYKEHIK